MEINIVTCLGSSKQSESGPRHLAQLFTVVVYNDVNIIFPTAKKN